MKSREYKQASSLGEVIAFLGHNKYKENIWVGKNYSLKQLIEDLEKINEQTERT